VRCEKKKKGKYTSKFIRQILLRGI
jgi:hypothetical protein